MSIKSKVMNTRCESRRSNGKDGSGLELADHVVRSCSSEERLLQGRCARRPGIVAVLEQWCCLQCAFRPNRRARPLCQDITDKTSAVLCHHVMHAHCLQNDHSCSILRQNLRHDLAHQACGSLNASNMYARFDWFAQTLLERSAYKDASKQIRKFVLIILLQKVAELGERHNHVLCARVYPTQLPASASRVMQNYVRQRYNKYTRSVS